MSEQLRFDLLHSQSVGYRLAINVPAEVWNSHQANEALRLNVNNLMAKRANALVIEQGHKAHQLLINDKKIGSSPAAMRLAQRVGSLITGLDLCSTANQKDSLFTARLGVLTANPAARQRMLMQIAWPSRTNKEVSDIASYHMQKAALKLQYKSKNHLQAKVFAQVERESGVILETNYPEGSQAITNGAAYRPTMPYFQLHDQNIYSPIQQLICLIGGVAIARADSLATDRPIC